MGRFIAFLYGLASYVVFFVTFLYAIGFVEGLWVPKTIDTGTVVSLTEALVVDVLLMSLFAIQHSVMARKQFKQWWTQYVPKSIERSTYVLLASLALVLLFWQWRPYAGRWCGRSPIHKLAMAIIGPVVRWLAFIVLTSTFLINHFELFGLHQVANNLAGRPMPQMQFQDADALQGGAPPDLSRLHHRVLGGANHDRGPPALRGGDHGLHFRRHRP